MMRRTISLPLLVIVVVLAVAAVIYRHHTGSYIPIKSPAKTNPSLSVGSGSPEVHFKEWGLTIKTPSALSGMSYEITQPTPDRALPAPVSESAPANNLLTSRSITRLYLDKYQVLANQCFNQDTSKKQPFASLVKTDGKPLASDLNVLKTFNGYYISNLGPSIDNRAKCTNAKVQTDLASLNNNLQTALKNAFSTAKEDAK
jgi:hypothetical protein